MDVRLGRLKQFDERSRAYSVRALVAGLTPRSYTWAVGVRLDQGQEGSCVGHAVAHEAAARPVVVANVTHEIAVAVYQRAQQLDDIPGEGYEGTSVLAGMKAAAERGWYLEYRWAFGLDDLILAIGRHGPAILGINWYESMMNVDADGYVRVGGGIAGGHAILANGVNITAKRVRLTNSWGSSWGWNGQAWITFDDLDRLLREQGEAAIPVTRRL